MPQGKQDETRGFQDNLLPLSIWEQSGEADTLALIFPGLGYHADLPVLYYAALQLYSAGADVVRLRFHYDQVPGFMQQLDKTINTWLETDAAAVLAFGRRKSYPHLSLTGKSLGTIALAGLLLHQPDLDHADCLWLTPVLTNPLVVRALREAPNPGLVVIGSADPYYSADLLDELAKKDNLQVLLIPGADHSLEIPGDALASVRAIEKMVEGIRAFFSR